MMPNPTFPSYAQWKRDNNEKLLERCYAKFGHQIQEYEDFFEHQYEKAKKASASDNEMSLS